MRADAGTGRVGAFERVASVSDVMHRGLLGVTLASGERVCLAVQDGEVFGVLDRCTHQAFPLSEGELTPEGHIVCAWHGAEFDPRSGHVCRGPAAEDVECVEVRVESGEVYVRATR
jgi:nitrite reductase/ring-hydroxylating ferredoxin subunit